MYARSMAAVSLTILALTWTALAPVAVLAAEEGAANSCIECHKTPEFFARYPKLHTYYEHWVDSPHAIAGVTCDDCHGGKNDEQDASRAHLGVLPQTEPNSRLFFKNQPKTCGRCHADNLEQFRTSRHYAALMEDRTAPTCTTCHPAMSQRPLYRNIVQNACRNCHAPGNEAELPLVAEKAEHALHQLNIAKGFLGWSVIHFEALGWPDDSQAEMEVLAADYDRIVSKIHRFDLARTDAETGELMRRLQRIFNEAKEASSSTADR